VEALAWRFIDEFNALGYRHVDRLEGAALEAMTAQGWPGNVRELRNNIEHAFAAGDGPVLRRSELSPELRGAAAPQARIDRTESERIVEALKKSGNRRDEAARSLGMSRTTLWRKVTTGAEQTSFGNRR
jgi:transcriptional regulator of acetoin/glycerol metabolism